MTQWHLSKGLLLTVTRSYRICTYFPILRFWRHQLRFIPLYMSSTIIAQKRKYTIDNLMSASIFFTSKKGRCDVHLPCLYKAADEKCYLTAECHGRAVVKKRLHIFQYVPFFIRLYILCVDFQKVPVHLYSR